MVFVALGTSAIAQARVGAYRNKPGRPFGANHTQDPVWQLGNPTPSTHSHRLHFEEGREFFNLVGDVAYANRAVMRWTLPIPGVHEISGIERKFVATIGIADLQDGAGDRVPFGGEKFELSVTRLYHCQKRHRPVLYGHLD